MRTLPETHRVTVYLADVKGYSYREIAAITGIPVGSVKSRLHRGRGRLRALITAQQSGPARPGPRRCRYGANVDG